MKKLVVLILFMFMVAAASAGIYNPGWYFTIDTVETVDMAAPTFSVSVNVGSSVALGSFSGSGGAKAMMTITGGTISSVVLTTAGDWASVPTPGIGATSTVITIDAEADGDNAIATGTVLFTFDVTATSVGTLIIDASSGNWGGWVAAVGDFDGYYAVGGAGFEAGTAGYKEVTVTPEPMTLALLGLGGLFLRRRRKA